MAFAKKYILSKEVAEKKLRRMALEIIENNSGEKQLILAGIRERGAVVAKCIQKMLAEFSSFKTELIHIKMDKHKPGAVTLSKKIDLNGKVVIVIDDVADSGRTLLYSLKPFLDFHPKKIQTLVLVERSHNSFPVRPDYVGLSVSTTLQEHIYVEVDKEKVLGAYLK
ncbi:MAG TPA: phosphoribosyltransferase family protein [Chitinophagaceae bacterium]|jgi:pyrimidine operon attenuation protein/uracil phosphoribosyltransferase|nr:phosphoribosyltransferase family protein [Chitinophagaceae bacterium]